MSLQNESCDGGFLHSIGVRFVSLIIPVAITMLAVVWSVTYLSPLVASSGGVALPVNEDEASGTGEKLLLSVRSSLVVLAAVVLMTLAIVVLYRCHLQFIVYGWLGLSALYTFSVALWIWIDSFCTYFQLPYNTLTLAFFIWNFGVVGCVSVLYHGHPAVTQAYLLTASILMAWSLSSLPEWTTWSLLISISIYDIVAVLWHRGPLYLLLQAARERNAPIPGLVYDSERQVAPIVDPEEGNRSGRSVRPPSDATGRLEGGVPMPPAMARLAPFNLGLGDFIFYSLLVGRASISGFIPWTFSFISILCGMVGTLSLLLFFHNRIYALPALPFSIFLSTAVFIVCTTLVVPMSEFASVRLLVL